MSICATKISRAKLPSAQVFRLSWGGQGSDAGQFNEPIGIAIATDGTIVVVDSRNCRIQCFQPDGHFIRKWGAKGVHDGEFKYPRGVSVDVCGAMNMSILHAMMQVDPVSTFPPGISPICASYVGDECIYVADSCNHRIQVFGLCGEYRRQWGLLGDGDGEFNYPSGCTSANHIIYVTDSWNNRIQEFRMDGTFIRKSNPNRLPLFNPFGVCVSRNGQRGYVSDTLAGIVSFDCDETDSYTYSHRMHQICGKGTCRGMWIDDDLGIIYIVDKHSHQIWQTSQTGRDSGNLHPVFSTTSSDRLSNPECIAKGPNGLLYVTDGGNHRIVAIQWPPETLMMT